MGWAGELQLNLNDIREPMLMVLLTIKEKSAEDIAIDGLAGLVNARQKTCSD